MWSCEPFPNSLALNRVLQRSILDPVKHLWRSFSLKHLGRSISMKQLTISSNNFLTVVWQGLIYAMHCCNRKIILYSVVIKSSLAPLHITCYPVKYYSSKSLFSECFLTHFMPPVSFYTLWKHQKTFWASREQTKISETVSSNP